MTDVREDPALAGSTFHLPGSEHDSGRVVDSYALSPLQQGMLFHWLRAPGAGVDHEQIGCTMDGIDIPTYERSWRELVARHASLRTRFRWRGIDAPLQEVVSDSPLSVHHEDLRSLDAERQRQRVEAYLEWDRVEGFHLDRLPLFRLAFFRTGEHRHEFVWSVPHILLDGRSFVILMRELLEIYRAFETGVEPTPQPRRPYRDFVEWLADDDTAHSKAKSFWSGALAGFDTPTFPELEAPPATDAAPEYAERATRLSRAESDALRAFAKAQSVTVNTLVQGAWAMMLGRYNRTDDVVFGATRACRRTALDGDPAALDMVGLFINTLPVRVCIPPEQLVSDWLRQIRADQVAVREVEHSPLTLVQESSALHAGIPLFDTLVVFESEQQTVSFDAMDPRCHDFHMHEKSTYPISLHAFGEGELVLRIEYFAARFDHASVERMLGHLATLLREMVAHGDAPTRALQLLTATERQQVLHDLNATDVNYGGDPTLQELISAQAARSPEQVALVFDDQSLTFAELDARAGTLARTLANRGVGPGVLVGVCMERSIELMVALVGILRAGGAYVPLDPEYPAERLAYMLRDARCSVLLTQRRIAEGALAAMQPEERQDGESSATVLCIDRDWDAIVAEASTAREPARASPDDLAYMIYTSGSTGRPKGALNAHRGIVNRLRWMQETYRLTAADVVLQKTPVSFDVSVWELFWPLMTGATLVLARPGGHRDARYLAALITHAGVTVCHFVPSMLRAFLAESDAAEDAGADGVRTHASQCASLRDVMASGEALAPDLVAAFHRALPTARLHNLYGPTECAVDVTYWPCPATAVPPAVVPIGWPVANTRMYVLDLHGAPQPVGVAGELYIAGVQVGRGYHGRPELTAERFVADPFAGRPAARMYRTGDLARWRADGTLEYLGRLDFQIKLRGFRIELGEIESALAQHPQVGVAVVVAQPDGQGESRLVAFVVPRALDGAAASGFDSATTDSWRAFLGASLPEHMIPSAFVRLDAIPLTPSGKVDRKALPTATVVRRARAYLEPRTESERAMASIWAAALGVERVGSDDGFIDLGGHSLVAMRVVGRVRRDHGVVLSLAPLLRGDSLAHVAALLDEARAARGTFATAADDELVLAPVSRAAFRRAAGAPAGGAE